jgi:periplasmic protein TonB
MRWWAVLGYSVSIAAHVALAAEIGSINKDRPRRPTTIKAFEAKREKKKEQKEEKKEDKPPPPPKKVEAPKQPTNTPPPPTNVTPTPAGHEAMAALPDFGIALSGGGEGGIAVPVAGMTAAASGAHAVGAAAQTEKKVRGPAPKPTDATDACVEEATKPKPTDKTAPQYVGSAAQSAGIEGVLMVEWTVDASGEVVDVKVVSGSNPKLDELALPAAKRWKFSPATKCGKPVPSKYVMRMRFSLGD